MLLDEDNQRGFPGKIPYGADASGPNGVCFSEHRPGPRARRGAAGTLPRRSVGELEEALGRAALGGVAGLQRPGGRALALRVGGRGVRALAGAAARLRAGAGLLHPPPLGQRGLIHVLEAEPLSLVFVEGLGKNSKIKPVHPEGNQP